MPYNTALNSKGAMEQYPLEMIYNQIPLLFIELLGREVERLNDDDKSFGISKKRHLGIFYTNAILASKLAEDCVALLDGVVIPKVLEPSSGNGIFIYAYLEAIRKRRKNLTELDFQNIINSCFLVDIDNLAIESFLATF